MLSPETAVANRATARAGLFRARWSKPFAAGTLASMLMMAAPVVAAAPTQAGQPLDASATAWRWIGVKLNGQFLCPRPQPARGWTTQQLFEDSENRELQRFCLYTRTTPGSASPLESLPLERLDPDLMAVGSQSSTLSDAIWKELRDHFVSQVEQVELPNGPPPRVRLALVDSSPTAIAAGAAGPEDIYASSPHGTALLNIVRDLVCDNTETRCRATVASRLALAYECFSPTAPAGCRNIVEGGFVGLIGDTARAIYQEVRDWQSMPTPHRLVVNLSLGWDPALGGGESNVLDMDSPIQAAYRVLQDAVCRGALVIAAAGNRGASSDPGRDPFLPALWETRPAPTANECRALGVAPAPGLNGPATYRPLLFSVAAVKASGDPIDTTRTNGVSRLAAFGDHAVVEQSTNGGPTGVLTGSSVASAVTSAIAAATWSYTPATDAFTLMSEVYDSGGFTGRQADYCLGGVPCSTDLAEVMEITACDSVAAVCESTGACTKPIALACDPQEDVDLSAADLSSFSEPAVPVVDMRKIDTVLTSPSECRGETIFYNETSPPPSNACPHYQYEGPRLQPWTEPQPESIPCPTCLGTFSSPGSFYIEIDDRWLGDLTDVTLKCGASSYALHAGPLGAGDRMRLTFVPEICLDTFETYFSFVHRGSQAVISPVFLCQDCR